MAQIRLVLLGGFAETLTSIRQALRDAADPFTIERETVMARHDS